MSIFLRFIVICGCLFLTSCSNRYVVSSNTFVDYQEIPQGFAKGSSFCLVSKNNENILFSREVEKKIATLLEQDGFKIEHASTAQYTLLFDFAISSFSEVVNTPKYIPGEKQKTTGNVSRSNGTYTEYEESTESSGQTVYVQETHVFFKRTLTIEVRNKHSEIPVWTGDFMSTGSSSDLREVMDYLLVSVVEYLGKNTGKCVTSSLSKNDKKIIGL